MEPEKTSPPGRTLFVILLLAIVLQFILLALAPGCATGPPPVPPAPPPFRDVVDRCYVSAWPTDADVCEGKFTASGMACVLCDVRRPCVLDGALVYCTPSCSDLYCGSEP